MRLRARSATTRDHQCLAFLRARNGSIAPLMAATLFVIFGAIGLCLDGGRAYTVSTQARHAVDAATLAAARAVSQDPNVDVDAVFNRFLAATLPGKYSSRLLSKSITKTPTTLSGRVDIELPMTFMQLFGFATLTFDAAATAEFGTDSVEIVLALDNTGSMSGSKLDALKTSAHTLVDALVRAAPSPDKLRIGLVPFARYVNVGMGQRDAPWLDVAADYTQTTRACNDTYPDAIKSNCRIQTGTCYNDGTPYTCSWEQCDWTWGTPVNVCSDVTTSYSWSGCVASRPYPLNLQDGSYGTRIPARMGESCGAPLTPLTQDRDTVRSAIDAMFTGGETYIPGGLMWGWRLLTPGAPFTESQAGTTPQLKRYLVLMTDGMNTASPTPSGHDGTDTVLANQYTREACQATKAAGITIFTVAFDVTDNAIKDILSGCASNPGYFFDAANSSQLTASFEAIAKSVSALRLTH